MTTAPPPPPPPEEAAAEAHAGAAATAGGAEEEGASSSSAAGAGAAGDEGARTATTSEDGAQLAASGEAATAAATVVRENDRCHVYWRRTEESDAAAAANANADGSGGGKSSAGTGAAAASSEAGDGVAAAGATAAKNSAEEKEKEDAPPTSKEEGGEDGQQQEENGEGEEGGGGDDDDEPLTLPAVVLKRRPSRRIFRGNKRRKTGAASSSASAAASLVVLPAEIADGGGDDAALDILPPEELEYYVHYDDQDRRLDQWIAYDMFDLDTLKRCAANRAEGGGGGLVLPSVSEAAATEATAEESAAAAAAASAAGLDDSQRSQLQQLRRRSSGGGTTPTDQQSATEDSIMHGGNWHAPSGDPTFAQYEREHEETTKIKNIERIVMGEYEVEAWYYSQFPETYSNLRKLYVCQYCLTYMKKASTYRKHRATCSCREPPGRRIYREGDLCAYELDGKEMAHKVYCQKLCLLAKLFLDHKTLFYDVTPFYFYVIAKVDDHGAHIVGYFSKEKVSSEGYNLACILTFPQYQQSGYGKFIISLSYELTKREGKTGSPEKPLSDLGKVSYRSYWKHALLNILADHDPEKENISISDISDRTGIKVEDIISTLQSLDMIKVWKGQHCVYVKQSMIEDYMKQNKNYRLCKSEFLDWEPPTQQQQPAATTTATSAATGASS